jgi:hypothetical protein
MTGLTGVIRQLRKTEWYSSTLIGIEVYLQCIP